MKSRSVPLPRARLAAYCRRNHIRRLSLFGSALGPGFRSRSDIDLLVEFARGKSPGYFGLERMQGELSTLLGGRRIDLRTPGELSPRFRDRVMETAEVQFERG